MKTHKSLPALFLIFIFISCNKEEAEPEENNMLTDGEKTSLQDAFTLPGDIYSGSFDLIETAINAVYQASAYSGTGQITTTGTLDLRGSVSYSSDPAGQLVVRLNEGSYSYEFSEFSSQLTQGDLRDNMQRDRQMAFRVSRFGQYDVEVVSQLQNGYRKTFLQGTLEANGAAYDIDMAIEGDYLFNVDNTGSELLINDRYGGTISCNDWEAEIDETWYYNNVYSTSAGVNAENATRSFNNSCQIGNSLYSFEDGRIQTVFRDGLPNEFDVANPPWAAEGRLFKDNSLIGELDWAVESAFIKIYLIAGNENVEMQSWRIR